MLQFQLTNDLAELSRLSDAVHTFSTHHHFDSKTHHSILLSLDELITNIISYGMAHQPNPVIELILDYKAGVFSAILRDNGVAFDPTQAPPPALHVPIEQQRLGGFGIFFVRRKMDQVSYERQNEWNVLTLCKNIPSNSV